MDKRWRNLGILLVVVIILIVAYFFVINQPSAESDLSSLENGYEELLNLFEKNDVNIEIVQEMNFFEVDFDKNLLVLANKSKLVLLKQDLEEFSGDLSRYSLESVSELKDISFIYISAINFATRNENNFQKVAKLLGRNDCSLNDEIQGLNLISLNLYKEIYELSLLSDAFAANHDPYAQPLYIDLESEYAMLLQVDNFVSGFETYCGGVE